MVMFPPRTQQGFQCFTALHSGINALFMVDKRCALAPHVAVLMEQCDIQEGVWEWMNRKDRQMEIRGDLNGCHGMDNHHHLRQMFDQYVWYE